MTIEQHIEELRAELKNAAERRQIMTELELAEAELAVLLTEDDDPPF